LCDSGYGGPNCSANYCGANGSSTGVSSSTISEACSCSVGWKNDGLGGICNVCADGWRNDNYGNLCNVCKPGYAGPNCLPDNLYCSNPVTGSHGEAPTQWVYNPPGYPCICNIGWVDDGQGGICNYCDVGYGGPNCVLNYCGSTGNMPNLSGPNAPTAKCI
jgi:hypothetical protein